jgi:hypothetical protein
MKQRKYRRCTVGSIPVSRTVIQMSQNPDENNDTSSDPKELDNVEVLPVTGSGNEVSPDELNQEDEVMVRLKGPFVQNLPSSMQEGTSGEQMVSVPMGLGVDEKKQKDNFIALTLRVDDSHYVKLTINPGKTLLKKVAPEEAEGLPVSPLMIGISVLLVVEIILVILLVI